MEEKWGSAAEAFWKQVVIQLSQIYKHKVQATRPTTAVIDQPRQRDTAAEIVQDRVRPPRAVSFKPKLRGDSAGDFAEDVYKKLFQNQQPQAHIDLPQN